jgi:parvulin-like peptidyl-prolyl isomerase
MRRLLLLLLPLALLGATACNSSSGGVGPAPAATVDGQDISQAELLEDLQGFANADSYGETEGSFKSEYTTQVLSLAIYNRLIATELEARGVEATPEDREAAEEQFESLVDDPAAASEAFRERQVSAIANQVALTRELESDAPESAEVTDEDVRAYYDENIEQILAENGEFVCASHILVETPEAVADAQDRLAKGESFADVAASLSTDTQSAADGGNLGCQPQGSYVGEFEEAAFSQPINEVGEPVETEFGFHLILVRSRGGLPFEEVEGQIRQILTEQSQGDTEALVSEWLSGAVAAADVTIDPQYGTWSSETGVVPPEGAESPAGTEVPQLDLGG